MKTVVLGQMPAELEAFIQRRKVLGIDKFDEIWEGIYHVAPAPSAAHAYLDNVIAVLLDPHARSHSLVGTGPFNLGSPDDYRVPDRGYHRGRPRGVWVPTAAVVVKIVSPDDETYEKFGFYASRSVDELVVVDPAEHRVTCWHRRADDYEESAASNLLGVAAADLVSAIDWPDLGE